MKSDPAAENYSKRPSLRLIRLLDDEGGPSDLLGRIAVLKERARLSDDEARQLLGGMVVWRWDQLDRMCKVFMKTPGFFLDPEPETPAPSDTKRVPSSEGGETAVLRVPKDFGNARAAMGLPWRYATARGDSGPFRFGSMVVYAEGWHELSAGRTYAIESDERLDFLQCEDIRGSIASFRGFDPSTSRILQISGAPFADTASTPRIGPRILGGVVASIQPH